MIFVFGSNLQGIHGAGAALYARKFFAARWGEGVGRTGEAYAIPTKKTPYERLSLEEIQLHVKDFLKYAGDHPELTFKVTAIGTGLAGYTHQEIAPMFKDVPRNCLMPSEWMPILLGDMFDEFFGGLRI